MDSRQINDLRSALDLLAEKPGQLVSTDVEVDPYLELAGVYRRVGVRHAHRAAHQDRPGHDVRERQGLRTGAWSPACSPAGSAPPCSGQHRQEPDVRPVRRSRQHGAAGHGLRRGGSLPGSRGQGPLRPARLTSRPSRARPRTPVRSSTWACCGPRTRRRAISDVTIHRMCVQGPDRMSVSFTRGPAHRRVPDEGRAMGKSLPGLVQHRPRPGHLRGHLVRGAHHSAGLRRTHHRGRSARPRRWNWWTA